MRTCARAFFVYAAFLLAANAVVGQYQAVPVDDTSINGNLEIGPVGGLTTIWHNAPSETAVPLGATLQFRVRSQGPVHWSGARVTEIRGDRSVATYEARFVGRHVVTAEFMNTVGEWLIGRTVLDVVDTSLQPVRVSAVRLTASAIEPGEENLNASTMRYFFRRESIADVKQIGEAHYLTSTNRWFTLQPEVEPSGFEPLIEWRHDGAPLEPLGAIRMQLFTTRTNTISGGPVDDPQGLSIETYWVKITSHRRGDEVPERTPITWTAETVPPGYEDEITWMASTKYGSCRPLMGSGPEFTVTFDDTFGEGGRWLGVRADNQTVGQDHKTADPGSSEPEIELSAQAAVLCQGNLTHSLEIEWRVTRAQGRSEVEILVLLEDGTSFQTEGGPVGSAEFDVDAPAGGTALVVLTAQTREGLVPDPAQAPDFTRTAQTVAVLAPCTENPVPDPGEGFVGEGNDFAPPGDGKAREVDVAHLGGLSGGAIGTRIATAVGSGAAVRLASWTLDGAIEAVLLEQVEPVAGFDVRLHVLTPDVTPKLSVEPFLTAMRRQDGNLWLSTYTVDESGELTRHHTLGYGENAGVVVVGYGIAHRPLVDPTTSRVDRFLVVTPVLSDASTLRLVTWEVDADTLQIRGLQDSGDWGSPAPKSFVDTARTVAGSFLPEFDEEEFIVNYRTSDGKLVSHFWHVDSNGRPSNRRSAASGLRLNGALQETDFVSEAAVATLHPKGYVTAYPEDGAGSPRLVVWEPRITQVFDNLGAIVTPYRITDDSVDQDPDLGVETEQPVLEDDTTPSGTQPVRGLVTDAQWEKDFGVGEGEVFLQTPASPPAVGIASVTKVMTLLLALEAIERGDVNRLDPVTVSAAAAATPGSTMNLREGEIISLEDLMYGMMIESGNDAAVAIAEHVAGSSAAFVMRMNDRADDIGLSLATTYGQPAGGGYSTPQDQVTLWLFASDQPDFQTFTRTTDLLVTGMEGADEIDHFLSRGDSNYPGLGGWKGGSLGFRFGDSPPPLCTSGGCLVTEATRLGRTYVVMLQQDRNPGRDSSRLFDYAVRNQFTPDPRADSGFEGGPAEDFGLDSVTDTLAVTAVINDQGDLELCPWQVEAGLGQVHKLPGCREVGVSLDPGDADQIRARGIQLVRISTLEVAGDFLRGVLKGGQLQLDVWRIGPTLPPSRR